MRRVSGCHGVSETWLVAPRVGGKRISTPAGGNGAVGVLVGRAGRARTRGPARALFRSVGGGTWEAQSSVRVRVAFPRPGAGEEDGWQRGDRPRRW